MCRVSSACCEGAAAEAETVRIPRTRVVVAILLLLVCWPARPARARVGSTPPPEPDGLTEAPLGIRVDDPSAACAWSGRGGDPRLPVFVEVRPGDLADNGFLRGALSCARRHRLDVVARILPPPLPAGAAPMAVLSPWLDDVESFLHRNVEELGAIEIPPGREHPLDPATWAFVVEKISSVARSFGSGCSVVGGPLPLEAGGWQADRIPRARIRPYLDGLSITGGADPAAALSRAGESLPVWVHLNAGGESPELLRRAGAAQRAGARMVTLPVPRERTARKILESFLLELPARYVPDPDPPGLEGEGSAAGEPLAWWADTLGPERAALLAAPSREGAMEIRLEADTVRSLRAFDLSTGRELAGAITPGERGSSEVILHRVRGPVLIRYVAETGSRGGAETVGVTASVELTAAEIIARLRAVEEAQHRATSHYTARATLSFHYRAEALNESIDVTSVNRFFWRDGVGEYEELELYINGARWRGEAPSLPFIQPEKVKDVPVEVRLDPSYSYRLEGREKIDGREVYVLDFDPIQAGQSLYSGRVWIDAEDFTRRRIRLTQHGLRPPITSSEDVIDFGPPPGAGGGHWVPLEGYRQMVFTVLGRTVAVERRVIFSDFVMNDDRFQEARGRAYASGNRISRDDDQGFAYMVPGADGARIRQDATMRNVAFFGGLSLGTPIVSSPAAGLNYFDFDYRGTGTQVDIAWAGPFVNAAWTDPSLAGSRWELSAEGRLIGVREKLKRTTDDGRLDREDLEILEERIWTTLARPLTTHTKGEIMARVTYQEFAPSDSTGDRMVIPGDLLTTTALARWRYNRAGARLELWGSWSWRGNWDQWGFLADPGLDPNAPPQREGARGGAGDDDYAQWGLSFTKAFYPGSLHKIGLGLEASAGSGMDRFSRFRIGDYQGVRVRGFNGSDLTFDRGAVLHLSWLATLPRTAVSLQLSLDGAVIENREDFLEDPSDQVARNPSFREYLVGGSLGVSFNGPWGTLVSVSGGSWIDSSISMSSRDTSLRVVMVKTFGDWPWKRSPVEEEPRSARLERPEQPER